MKEEEPESEEEEPEPVEEEEPEQEQEVEEAEEPFSNCGTPKKKNSETATHTKKKASQTVFFSERDFSLLT